MPTHIQNRIPKFHQGQAMVEYAILFIVLSILFIGGAELGMAALASYKNTDAAKTGISEYAEVNQRRLNILNAEKQYSLSLKSVCANIFARNPDGDTETISDSNGVNCESDSEYVINFTDYRSYLDEIHNEDNINGLLNYALRVASDGAFDDFLSDFDSDNDNFLSDDELAIAEVDIYSNNSSIPIDLQNKYSRLILIQHLKLSRLPLQSNENLSQARITLGNHATTDFISQPKCNSDGSYDYGFPEGDVDVDGDGYFDGRYIAETGEGYKVYLFNPLPIDVASCTGSDASRGGRSRLSILVGGYINPNDPTKNVPGLPKLNQAMYGMYKNDLNGNLIPPGKMCTSDDDCPNQPNENLYVDGVGPTGYYRWNKGSDGSGTQDLFKYTINDVDNDLLNGFRPAMQIDCNVSSNSEESAINDISCQTIHTKVRIHTRYRKIFEGFLTFGLQEINIVTGDLENALKLFYNPNNVGVAGSNQVNGTIDSEIGSLGANGIPSVKRHKDFRGCYEVDVETNQISACN